MTQAFGQTSAGPRLAPEPGHPQPDPSGGGAPPAPPQRPTRQAEAPPTRPHRPSRDPWWRRIITYPLLIAMATADAFGFWNTLTEIIKRDTTLVLVFVLALSIGAVATPHEVGRLLRSRREGYGGSLLWMVFLSGLWLSLGLTMAWLRANSRGGAGGGRRGGVLAETGDTGLQTESVHIAILLLILFLLTGALAMNHGYRYGDPRSAEVREAYQRRAELAREVAQRAYDAELAQGRLTKVREDRKREERARSRDHEIDEARYDHFRTQARQETARHIGDPAGTDELNRTWRPAGGTAGPGWSEPPEI